MAGAAYGTRFAIHGGVSQPSATYAPRIPSYGVVYQVVRDHFETFRAQTRGLRDGEGLPRFVEQEFRALLRCGCLAGGFARFRCDDCGLDRLVPFSCKGRAVCASCGGRRMADRAAHLVDDVFPAVPVRQWVLTFPHRLGYRLAWDHDLCRSVVGVSVRTVLGFLRHAARQSGVADGRGGAVAIIQRFGGALNLNVHAHALVMDGVFARDGPDVRFCPTPWLTAADVADVLATIVPRVRALLERRGVGDGEEGAIAADEWAEDAPVLAGMAGASVLGTFALGSRAGKRARPCGAVPVEDQVREDHVPGSGRCHARQEGFDLEAGVWVPAAQRDRLERLCRYALRPTVAQERLRLTAEGQVVLRLCHPWWDGTTHLLFDPLGLLERLAVLIPRPRINLILYHGVLGPRAAWPFGDAQGHPEQGRRMAVARRGFREHHRRRRGHHCRRAQGRSARRPPRGPSHRPTHGRSGHRPLRGQRHRAGAPSALRAGAATAPRRGTALGGPDAPNLRDRRVGLSALRPFGVAQGHPEHGRRMAGASG